jgi:hypothetical protein
MLVFRVVTPCGLVGRYQRFGKTHSLQPWRWREYVSPKRWYLLASTHRTTTQKTNIDVFTAVTTLRDVRFKGDYVLFHVSILSTMSRLLWNLSSIWTTMNIEFHQNVLKSFWQTEGRTSTMRLYFMQVAHGRMGLYSVIQKEAYTFKNLFYKYYWTYSDVLYIDWRENSQSYVHTSQALDVSPTCDAADVKLIIQLFPHCT